MREDIGTKISSLAERLVVCETKLADQKHNFNYAERERRKRNVVIYVIKEESKMETQNELIGKVLNRLNETLKV